MALRGRVSQVPIGKLAQEDWVPILSASLQAFLAAAGDRAALVASIAEHVSRIGDVECELGLWRDGDPRRGLQPVPTPTTGPISLFSLGPPCDAPTSQQALLAGRWLRFEPGTSAVGAPPLSQLAAAELSCLAYIPVCTPHRSWGVIAVAGRAERDALSEADLQLLRHLADCAAIALEHGQALLETREALDQRERMTERLHALAKASRDFAAATSDYRKLLDVVARTVGQLLGDVCSIRLISRDGYWLNVEDASVFHPDPEVAEAFRRTMQASPQRVDAGMAGEVVQTGRALVRHFPEVGALARATLPEYRPLLSKVDIASLMLLPLMSHERCLGLLSLSRGRDNLPFSADDLQLASDLADRAALAVENAALLVDLRARVDEVEQAEDRFRRLLESAPDALALTDKHGHLVLVNAQTERLFGYTRAELLGHGMQMLLPTSSHDALSQLSHDPLPNDGASSVEVLARRKDATQFPAEVRLSPIHTRDGHFIMAVIRDATERRRLEEARVRTRELEDDNRRAHEANRLKSEFLANMSHELRTPLNAIIGFSALMHAGKAGALSEAQFEYLGDILTSSRHLLQLINDVLDLAKIEAGRVDLRPELVDLTRLASEVRDILRGSALEKRVNVSLQVAAELNEVIVDPRVLKQILYNYLSNAIKFTPELGAVRVVIEAVPGGCFALRVLDTGVGIRQQDLPALFKEFEQLDDGSGKRQGTGLGLALTKRLVEAQGGTVSVQSTLGEGSEFVAVLPRQPTEPN